METVSAQESHFLIPPNRNARKGKKYQGANRREKSGFKVKINTWIKAKTISTMIAPNRNGPKKLKSWPFLAAQNVYKVRLTTTTAVRITDSNITFPVQSET